MILEKNVEGRILHGDCLSHLLFVLCIDPLSRRLNVKYQKVDMKTENNMHTTNHLLFIDDLKLIVEEENQCVKCNDGSDEKILRHHRT
jgi:hypothetical protein